MQVTVELKETDTICSLASFKKKYRTTVSVAGKSSRAVPFVIIPLVASDGITIEVIAREAIRGSDGVQKKLKVVVSDFFLLFIYLYNLDINIELSNIPVFSATNLTSNY